MNDRDEARGAVIFGTVLGAGLAAAGWCWSYGLAGVPLVAAVALHLAGGAVLGALLADAARFAFPRFESGLLAGALLAGVVPAAATAYFPGQPDQALLAAALASLLALAVCLALARAGRVPTWAALLLAGAAGLWLTATPHPPAAASAPRPLTTAALRGAPAQRVAVIGLDSADWQVLDPLLAAGELPNLAGLIARGRSAVLHSAEPTQSPVVWTSIFSGRTPEAHGITGWANAHSGNRRAGVLWEMVTAAGASSVVVNVPGTWPPTPLAGALVSGFPIPGALLHAGRDARLAQNVGSIVSPRPREGPLHTTVAAREDAEHLRTQASLGGYAAPTRTRWRHFLVEAALARGWLARPEVRIAVELPAEGMDEIPSYRIEGRRLELPRGAWSPWLATPSPIGALHFRARRLADDSLFVTPAFQDPRAPLHPYTSSAAVREVIADLGMYVVEPAGWKSADDRGARDALYEHLLDVEGQHLRAALALRAEHPDWRLFAHVVTLPDRVSHPFWRFHRPQDYPPLPPGELLAHRDKLTRAYRVSDRMLGRLLEGLGPQTAVIVASDHGSASHGDTHGDHRIEGVLVAAGPGIAPGEERLDLSIYDVAPLALTLLGMPVAEDFAGTAPPALLAPGVTPSTIPSYERTGAGAPAPPTVTIDESTQEQLRGLGYIE